MRLLVTGKNGVLGRATIPLLRAQGHQGDAPSPAQLDLFDPVAVARAVDGAAAILHLATRIPPRERAWARKRAFRAIRLEDRQRVQGEPVPPVMRSGAAMKRIPSALPFAGREQVLELQIVEQVDARRIERQDVDREVDPSVLLGGVTVSVAAEH